MVDGISILDHLRTCQNQVFKAVCRGELCVLRLTDPAHRSREQLCTELALLTDLHAVAMVVQPLPFPSGDFIQAISYEDKLYNGILFSFVNGSPAPVLSYAAAATFGSRLATLHAELAKLTNFYDLPIMEDADAGRQLIHGDFNPTNVLATADSFIVIDFDSACYASYEYEIANSIYMTMFDLRHDVNRLLQSGFVEGLLAGYTSNMSLDLTKVRNSIGRRVAMVQAWLDDVATAPLPIATSPESWRKELRDFVAAYKDGKFEVFVARVV